MPETVDFLLAFGITEHPKDFQYSGFRSQMRLGDEQNRLILRTFGRSGRELRLCHLLRSVEREDFAGLPQQTWPWQLQATLTYHAFDVETEQSVWLIVKANGLIKRRIGSICEE